MATSTIYFNRSGTIELDIGAVDFAHYAKITLKIGDTIIHTSPNLATSQDSYNWTPTDAEKALIISLIPTNATSIKGVMKKDVYWSVNNSEANFYDREFEVSFVLEATENTKPEISGVSILPLELANYVQNKSKLEISFIATAQNNASIKSVTVKVRGVACTLVSSVNGTYEFESGLLTYSGTNTITVEATDTRGFKRTLSESVYVYPYAPPIISSIASEDGVVCKRWNSIEGRVDEINGTQCRVMANVSASYVPDVLQNFSVYYRYKKTGATNWSDERSLGTVDLPESGSIKFEALITEETFGIDFEYDIEIKVVDTLEGTMTRYEQLPSSKVSFNIKANGMGAAFGKYSKTDNRLDSAWDIHTEGSLYADENLLVAKAIKCLTLFLNGIEVEATAQELSYTKGSTGNFQSQINTMSSKVSSAISDIATLKTKVSTLEGKVAALESK